MVCGKCGAQNSETSKYCRYCANPLWPQQPAAEEGYVPSVPPPGAGTYVPTSPPLVYQQPIQPPMVQIPGQLRCPHCGSPNVIKGGIPLWATLVAIIGFFFICVLSLLFLLVKDPNRCLNCGLEFK